MAISCGDWHLIVVRKERRLVNVVVVGQCRTTVLCVSGPARFFTVGNWRLRRRTRVVSTVFDLGKALVDVCEPHVREIGRE